MRLPRHDAQNPRALHENVPSWLCLCAVQAREVSAQKAAFDEGFERFARVLG